MMCHAVLSGYGVHPYARQSHRAKLVVAGPGEAPPRRSVDLQRNALRSRKKGSRGINVVAQTAVVAGIGALLGAAIAVPELRVIEFQENFLAKIGVDVSKVSPAETRALRLAAIGAAAGAGIGGGWMGSGALRDAKNY